MAQERTGGELFLRALVERGIRFLFINPGTDTFPVQEAYAKMQAEGEALPEMLLCPFENLASTAAQGAYVALGVTQAALVHVDVGTANAAGTLNDAKANRTPVLLCAGTSPVSQEPVPGGRSKFINWVQDVPDQAALVRNYVKNEQAAYQPEAIPRVIHRALQVAESDPAGPVYVTFPRETLMATTDLAPQLDAARFQGVSAGAARDEDVATVARWIAEAQRPMVVTGYAGRDEAAVDALVELSETAGVGVVEYRGRVNFPLTHPHHLGFHPEVATEHADLLLVIEHDVPYVPLETQPPEATRLVHLGADPYFETQPSWGFPSDLGLRADPAAALRQLTAAVAGGPHAVDPATLAARRDWLAERHEDWTGRAWAPTAANDGGPLPPAQVGQILHEVLPNEVAIFEEAVTSSNPLALQLRDLAAGSYHRNGGTYLGWALGAAMGYGLARSDRLPVAILGEGSFLFAVPSSGLWFARQHQIPMLTVVLDNSAYNSVRLAARDGYPDGWQVQHGYVGTDLDGVPPPDGLAEACGVAGFAADGPDAFRTALKSALDTVAAGHPALVTVRTALSDQPT